MSFPGFPEIGVLAGIVGLASGLLAIGRYFYSNGQRIVSFFLMAKYTMIILIVLAFRRYVIWGYGVLAKQQQKPHATIESALDHMVKRSGLDFTIALAGKKPG